MVVSGVEIATECAGVGHTLGLLDEGYGVASGIFGSRRGREPVGVLKSR